jgi:hypothetical protein
VLEAKGYGAMVIVVKTFFAVFFVKKTPVYQLDSRLSAEIGLLHFHKARSRGKRANRKILCLHTLSTLCSIDFELRHTFPAPLRRTPPVEMHFPDPTSASRA